MFTSFSPIPDLYVDIAGWISALLFASPYLLWARLTKIEHDDFPAQWEDDGRPLGMPFWFPVDGWFSSSFRSSYSILGTVWLFRTPNWVKESSKARRVFLWYRIASYIVYASVTAICLLMLLLTTYANPH